MKRRIKGGDLYITNIFYIKLLFDKSIVMSAVVVAGHCHKRKPHKTGQYLAIRRLNYIKHIGT